MTIENVPIFANNAIEIVVGEILSIYTVMWFITYVIVGRFYERGENPTFGSLAYFFIYLIVALVFWLILLFLTWLGVLPIG